MKTRSNTKLYTTNLVFFFFFCFFFFFLSLVALDCKLFDLFFYVLYSSLCISQLLTNLRNLLCNIRVSWIKLNWIETGVDNYVKSLSQRRKQTWIWLCPWRFLFARSFDHFWSDYWKWVHKTLEMQSTTLRFRYAYATLASVLCSLIGVEDHIRRIRFSITSPFWSLMSCFMFWSGWSSYNALKRYKSQLTEQIQSLEKDLNKTALTVREMESTIVSLFAIDFCLI